MFFRDKCALDLGRFNVNVIFANNLIDLRDGKNIGNVLSHHLVLALGLLLLFGEGQ